MRVLMVAPTSFFSDYGGHIRILEEMRSLGELGVEVAVVTYYMGKDVPGIDIRRTAPLPWRTDYEVGSSRHKIAFDAYLAVKTAREVLRFRPMSFMAICMRGRSSVVSWPERRAALWCLIIRAA